MIRRTSSRDSSGLVWFKSSYSSGPEIDSCVEVAGAWFKSSYSDGSEGDSCVEIATAPATVHVRDSKNLDGPRLAFAPATWAGFLPYLVEG
ncbi:MULTISPECIES: DUF397 domain-containing protein [Streptomyces]|uniref:DUF397 domain-containing protein n=1 Tax=Streptomyces edwardsiae TaxID=3075527 RepID=A0ABU2Q161_9ACTN|nr:DUF397 domain-containing protein [Streptomyces sp. DSM 41636]MDT0398168.1 DUF397 domain-containing protein [Streptomyces sp. DSM 41636]